jgi:hypothetical protein
VFSAYKYWYYGSVVVQVLQHQVLVPVPVLYVTDPINVLPGRSAPVVLYMGCMRKIKRSTGTTLYDSTVCCHVHFRKLTGSGESYDPVAQ